MYYLISTNYVGPYKNESAYVDADRIEISDSPARKNFSREECIEGDCGTTNNFTVYAHGEYSTIEECRAAIAEKFGDVREVEGDNTGDMVETYAPGRYTPLTPEETEDWWASEGVVPDINAETPDAVIEELLTEYEYVANKEGYALHSSMADIMRARRQVLRDECTVSQREKFLSEEKK